MEDAEKRFESVMIIFRGLISSDVFEMKGTVHDNRWTRYSELMIVQSVSRRSIDLTNIKFIGRIAFIIYKCRGIFRVLVK